MVKKEETIEEKTVTRKIVRAKPKKKTASKKKKSTSKKKMASTKSSSVSETNVSNKILVENFASLQRVMTHLSERFSGLSNKIDNLLKLFEDSAKELVKKDLEAERERDLGMNVLAKIDSLLEQNKIIAKSMTMFYEQKPKKNRMNYDMGDEELIVPKPKKMSQGMGPSMRRNEEIKSPNKRQEDLGMKNPFVKEEEKEDWSPEFEMP